MEQKYGKRRLFTPDGFVWAQMLVRAIQTGDGTNVNAMIKGLAGWISSHEGEQTVVRRTTQCFSRCISGLGKTITVATTVVLRTLSSALTAPPVAAHLNN